MPLNISDQISSIFLIIQELKQYLFIMGKKQEGENLLDQEVIEMYENMKTMNELLEKIKKCNILCRPKRSKKIELNLFDKSIEALQFISPKQTYTQITSVPTAL